MLQNNEAASLVEFLTTRGTAGIAQLSQSYQKSKMFECIVYMCLHIQVNEKA